MKQQILSATATLAIAGALSACSALKSPHYVGAKETIDESDLASETVWMQGNDVYFVKRVDSNTVVAATMEWDAKKNEFTVRSFPLILSMLVDHAFLNVKDGELYTILRMARDSDESIILFTIDSDRMEKDIAAGKVKAHKEGGNIIMDGTKEEQDAYMLENIDTMFSMDCASIARKISKEKEPKTKKTTRQQENKNTGEEK